VVPGSPAVLVALGRPVEVRDISSRARWTSWST
jgi:hypothetical protein